MTLAEPLSKWWAGAQHRALGVTTNKAVRLAIALGAVKSVLRVVDRSRPPMSVDWAAHEETEAGIVSASYTDFTNSRIRINPGPILDPGIGDGRALDIVAGFSLHEASHSQESRDRHKYLIKRETVKRPNVRPDTAEDMTYRRFIANPSTVFDKITGEATREVPAFEPMRIAAYLWNVVEDVRIEKATSKAWPGFAPYFQSVLRYMWAEMRKHHEVPTVYGPTLVDKLRVAYIACRYPSVALGPALATEAAWWHAWQHDYLTDATDTPTTIQRGLDHLAEDAETKAELDKEAKAERAEREAGERLRAQIDRLVREGVKGGYEVCVSDNGELVPLDAETAEEVRKLVREGLVEVKTVVPAIGAANVPVLVRKPEETPASKRAYVGRPDATTEALRAALVFRPSAPEHAEKLLRSGQIDDEELYRWGAGDYRVFGERVVESKPDVFMGLLVDSSGSMCDGHKLPTAQRLAQLLTWAVADQEGIETQVWAHTTEGDASAVFRIWEKGDPLSRLGLIESMEHDSNADGHAVAFCASQIAQREQPEKVLVVLSDGIPSASSYGGGPAMDHVRAVTKWAEARGVRVIQIAIDRDLRPDQQSRMFGPEGTGWVGFRDYASLPRQIASLLGRYM